MNMLAEANKSPGGRWVIMPDKGERLLGSRDRNRLRIRRRRKMVFTVLLELTLLVGIIGLIPPLRPMLYGAAALGGILVLYTLLLMYIRHDEARRSRTRRLEMARRRVQADRHPAPAIRSTVVPNPYAELYGGAAAIGNGNGHHGNGARSAAGVATRNGFQGSNGNGARSAAGVATRNGFQGSNGNGSAMESLRSLPTAGPLEEVSIIEDDVHVVVRRASAMEVERLRAAL